MAPLDSPSTPRLDVREITSGLLFAPSSGMPALKIVRISHEEDVFAADETKVHTLSRQVISEMLDTAAREEVSSSAPPPPESGVRAQDANRPAVSKSGMVPKVPAPGALPVVCDEEDEDMEPTVLSERVSLPRHQLVTQLMNEPPIIICPEPITEAPVVAVETTLAPSPSATPTSHRFDRRALAITVATFLATLMPALVLLHHLLTR